MKMNINKQIKKAKAKVIILNNKSARIFYDVSTSIDKHLESLGANDARIKIRDLYASIVKDSHEISKRKVNFLEALEDANR